MHVTRGEAPGDARGERRDDREGRGEALRHALENGHPMHDAVVTAARAQIHCARRAARMRRRLVSVSRTSGTRARTQRKNCEAQYKRCQYRLCCLWVPDLARLRSLVRDTRKLACRGGCAGTIVSSCPILLLLHRPLSSL